MSLADYLRHGVDGLLPHWDEAQAELNDPVIGEPTQYGTAYFALANAAVGSLGTKSSAAYDRAAAATRRVLTHLANIEDRAAITLVGPAALKAGRGNHRDFMWPPVLRTVELLREAGHPATADLETAVAELAVPDTFNARPPTNSSSVWLSGEWRRIRDGRSPYTVADVDQWLEPYFEERIDLAMGFFREPGLPNSYDLFTRVHLQDMLTQGYAGRWSAEMKELAEQGLRRTLGVQLSDGSLASAHRSTAQTWTLSAQLAYLAATGPNGINLDSATARAHAALTTTLRPDGTISPVQNGLPPSYRIGYEPYTADAHYTSLALGFIAAAIRAGAGNAPDVPTDDRDSAHIEHHPTYRALRHRGRFSVHLNLDPHPNYDGFGIVDLTTGAGRRLHFISSAAVTGTPGFLNLGIAQRIGDVIKPVAHRTFDTYRTFAATSDGLAARARDHSGQLYEARIRLDADRVHITEALPDTSDPLTLLVPYLRDPGDGIITKVRTHRSGLTLEHGNEQLHVAVSEPVDRIIHIEHGLTNRRGLCGLVRIDIAERRDQLHYTVGVQN